MDDTFHSDYGYSSFHGAHDDCCCRDELRTSPPGGNGHAMMMMIPRRRSTTIGWMMNGGGVCCDDDYCCSFQQYDVHDCRGEHRTCPPGGNGRAIGGNGAEVSRMPSGGGKKKIPFLLSRSAKMILCPSPSSCLRPFCVSSFSSSSSSCPYLCPFWKKKKKKRLCCGTKKNICCCCRYRDGRHNCCRGAARRHSCDAPPNGAGTNCPSCWKKNDCDHAARNDCD